MKNMFYIKALQEGIIEEMERDNNVFMIGEDLGKYGGCFGVTRGMLKKFGKKRIMDTPMSETSIVGLTSGAALTGTRPIVEIMFMDFITLCMDQIINHTSKFSYIYGGNVKVPLVIRTPAGAGRRYGASHSQSLEALFMNIPGLKIAVPSSSYDVKGLIKTAIREENPVLFIENKMLYWTKGEVPTEEYFIPFGKAKIRKKGNDITIVSHSRMVVESLKAAEELESKGIKCEVIDLRTLNPLDFDTILDSVKKTGKLITVEEGYKSNGVGSEITSVVIEKAFNYLEAPIIRIAGENVPIAYSPVLEDKAIPDVVQIKGKILEILERKQ